MVASQLYQKMGLPDTLIKYGPDPSAKTSYLF